MRNVVYFDLETRLSAVEVGGWHNAAYMRMSVAVTYSSELDKYTIYTEETKDELIAQLRSSDLVVGYNHIGFDYEVLRGDSLWDLAGLTKNLDLCRDISERAGVRVKLDDVAKESIGCSKTAEGTQALAWWKDYEKNGNLEALVDIARYCCFDVKVTRDVHRFGAEHGFVCFSRGGEKVQLPVDWKL